jgi:hypothetical protein
MISCAEIQECTLLGFLFIEVRLAVILPVVIIRYRIKMVMVRF